MTGRDALDVDLVHTELQDELELTVGLILAANEATGPLGQDDIDELLGVQRQG